MIYVISNFPAKTSFVKKTYVTTEETFFLKCEHTHTHVFSRSQKIAPITTAIELDNPVGILNALGFEILYVCISSFVFYADSYLGNKGLILPGLISGFADVDAITINISN
jgi:uncharacterized membrane protein (DUF4010 family)